MDESSMWQGAFKYKMKNLGVLYVLGDQQRGHWLPDIAFCLEF